MSLHFHKITVKDIRKETANCISVSFDIPPDLQEEFIFVQGQNITIRKNIDGDELRRNYSLCTSPTDGDFRIAIKQMEGGKFSTWANSELKAGDVLELLPPTGKFNTALHPEAKKSRHMISTIVRRKWLLQRRVARPNLTFPRLT